MSKKQALDKIVWLLLGGLEPTDFLALPALVRLAEVLADNILRTCELNQITIDEYLDYPRGRKIFTVFSELATTISHGIPYVSPPPELPLPEHLHPVEYLFISERRQIRRPHKPPT